MGMQKNKSFYCQEPSDYERERLSILRSCNILDTPNEDCFDSLIHIVQETFNTRIALISLLDENRLWFKAKAGVVLKEVPREVAICSYSVLYNNVTIIQDLSQDVRFKDNPLVKDPHNIHFYAGAPIFVDGYKIGTVCILDSKPRHNFTGLDAIKLSEYAAIVSDLICMKRNVSIEKERSYAKSEFIHELSHEIKTPLNVITGISKILLHSKDIAADKTKLIKVMNNSAETLSQLVSTISDIEMIENKKLVIERAPFDIHKCLSDITKSMSVLAGNKNLALKTDLKALKNKIIDTDELRLKQVLINIIGNAIKYTDEGRIEFKVYDHAPVLGRDDYIQFSIRDTGLGIPEKDHGKIFNRFERVDRRTHHRDGSGLGLTITKNIVDHLGGIINFESEIGKGSHFWICFPKETLAISDKH